MRGARRTYHVRRSAARARGYPPQVGHRRWAFFSGLLGAVRNAGNSGLEGPECQAQSSFRGSRVFTPEETGPAAERIPRGTQPPKRSPGGPPPHKTLLATTDPE